MIATHSLTSSSRCLFDAGDRIDCSPASHEDSFGFMNRVDQPFWGRVRDALDQWFAGYPDEHASDLRARFRSADPAQHFAAWWELYLHRLFTCLGYEVEVHPELSGSSGRPDFRLRWDEGSCLIEAAATFSGIVDEDRNAERDGWIMVALEQVENPNFSVRLEVERSGLERPSVREIAVPVERWLSGEDPDAAIAAGFDGYPWFSMTARDWILTLTALPVRPEKRGLHKTVSVMPPAAGGVVNNVEKLKGTLDRKRRRYGTPEEPIVAAVLLVSGMVDDEDIEQALLGGIAWQFNPSAPDRGRWVRQRNGFWVQGGRARGTRISAVLTGTGLMPYNAASVWPRLWRNPWATRPLDAEFPFPTAAVDESGLVTYGDAKGTPARLLGLAEDWPGPERPFEKGSADQ